MLGVNEERFPQASDTAGVELNKHCIKHLDCEWAKNCHCDTIAFQVNLIQLRGRLFVFVPAN